MRNEIFLNASETNHEHQPAKVFMILKFEIGLKSIYDINKFLSHMM